MTPPSTRTQDRTTEATDCPGPLYPTMGLRPHAIQGTCDDTSAGRHEDPLTASSRRARRREGDGTEVPGSDQPQSSHVLYGTAGVLSSGAYAFHQSPLQLTRVCACACGLRTPGGDRPNLCAPQKDQSGSAAGWRLPKSSDQEDDGRLPSDKGNRPRDKAEWTTACWLHATATSSLHQSWWTLVYARSGNRSPSVHRCWAPRALLGRLLDGLLPLQQRGSASALPY